MIKEHFKAGKIKSILKVLPDLVYAYKVVVWFRGDYLTVPRSCPMSPGQMRSSPPGYHCIIQSSSAIAIFQSMSSYIIRHREQRGFLDELTRGRSRHPSDHHRMSSNRAMAYNRYMNGYYEDRRYNSNAIFPVILRVGILKQNIIDIGREPRYDQCKEKGDLVVCTTAMIVPGETFDVRTEDHKGTVYQQRIPPMATMPSGPPTAKDMAVTTKELRVEEGQPIEMNARAMELIGV